MPLTEGILKKALARLIKVFIIFSFLAVFNSFLQVFVISQSQEIKRLQSEIKFLEKDISRIKVEVASLESFDRIQSIALNELGMRTADTNDYHWIEALPAAGGYVPDRNVGLQESAKANLWERLYQLAGDIGKTMAQSL